jgi:hypothetical protein
MTPVTHAALAGSCATCTLRLRHVPLHSGLTKYPERSTGLTAFAAGVASRAAHTQPACHNRHMPERLEVQRAVAASPGEIFAVLTDPRGHVAIDSSGMLMGASGDIVAKAGDTFVVHMDRESLNDYPLGLYDVTIEIVTFEPDTEIAWTVHGQLDLGHVYGYRLEPIAEGTLVTSYYDWSAVGQDWKDAAIFPVIPESALRATLGILARTVAPGKPRPVLPGG